MVPKFLRGLYAVLHSFKSVFLVNLKEHRYMISVWYQGRELDACKGVIMDAHL